MTEYDIDDLRADAGQWRRLGAETRQVAKLRDDLIAGPLPHFGDVPEVRAAYRTATTDFFALLRPPEACTTFETISTLLEATIAEYQAAERSMTGKLNTLLTRLDGGDT